LQRYTGHPKRRALTNHIIVIVDSLGSGVAIQVASGAYAHTHTLSAKYIA